MGKIQQERHATRKCNMKRAEYPIIHMPVHSQQ